MSERTINVNAEWYETVTAEFKAKDKRIAELEAKLDSVRNEVIVFTTARCDCNDCYACGLKRMAQNVFTALGDDDGR